MRSLFRLCLASMLALAGCARVTPPSAPHPLLGESIRWPALRRVCAAPTQSCQSGGKPFERAAPRLVEFWSPSCAPCQRRLQELQRHRGEFVARGWSVEIVAVLGSDESDALVADSLQRWQLEPSSWVIAEDDSTTLKVPGLPSLWLVSSRDQLQWVAPAKATFEDVAKALDALD